VTFLSTIADCWLGLCRKPPVISTSPAVRVLERETTCKSLPDGGAGGSGTVGRGIAAVQAGIKTLIKNRRLLWFSFFTGLVSAGIFIAHYIIRLLSVYPYKAIDLPRWIVLTFATELASVLCLSVLLAGLVLSLSQKEGSPASFREGLTRAKKYIRPLANWSIVMALAGMLTFIVFLVFTIFLFPGIVNLHSAFSQFPFGFILVQENYHIGPMGNGTYAIAYGLTYALILSVINVLLFVLTLFVVPHLVLETIGLKEAIHGSVALMKIVWREVAVCVLVLGIVVFAASLISSLFQTVYGIVAPGMSPSWYPGVEWVVAAVVYMLALCGLAFIGTTVGGIASLDIYTHAKGRENA
jgi:hypothetical protein